MAANGTNQSRLRSVQGGSPTNRGQNQRSQNSNRNAMRGFGPSGSSNQSSGGSNMFGFSRPTQGMPQQYQNPFGNYQFMFGNQNPMLGRYTPPMMNGSGGWQNNGGYAYNLPNAWGGTGLNYGGNTFGGGGNQGGGLPFGIPQSGGDFIATLPWNPGSPDGRYGGNVDSSYPTPDEYFGRRASNMFQQLFGPDTRGGSSYDMLRHLYGPDNGQQGAPQLGGEMQHPDITIAPRDNRMPEGLHISPRDNRAVPPMQSGIGRTPAPPTRSNPFIGGRQPAIAPMQGPTTRTPMNFPMRGAPR